ncbi:MAG: hypothetical protein U5L00_04505 [Desulfovermiculus sp.]|nr:hypothetical protein [Desulfovermiculus sp.]
MENEKSILEELDKLVQESDVTEEIRQAKELLRQDSLLLAGTVPVPLNKLNGPLPAEIGSARIFALRANTCFKTERHPNSRQRVISIEGQGRIVVKDESSPKTEDLTSAQDAPLEQRWSSVPANTWHEPQAGNRDWVLLTFHQVPENELIDEYQNEILHPRRI